MRTARAAAPCALAQVTTDDIRKCALPALRHRVLINFEGEAEGVHPDSIISNALETLPTDARVPA